MTESHEVVVVGGGIAGLAAAWRLRDRDVLLLEAGDRLGGRLRSEPHGDDAWLNLGAHLFPGPGTLVDAMARDCGLETVPVTGSMMGLAVGAKHVTGGRAETFPLRLPLAARDRVAFAVAGARLRHAVARRRRLTAVRPGESAADVRARVLAFEDDRTFDELLGDLPPAVHAIFACAAHRATAEPSELSAGGGVGLFALVWGGRGSLIARNLRGGSGRLPAALGAALGSRARTGCRVTGIREDGAELVVEHADGAVRARHVVVAVQAPFAAPLVAPIARPAADALGAMTYGAFLTVAVATTETAPVPWDGVYAMATPGRVFDMFINQADAFRAPLRPRRGGSLMLFAGGRAAAELLRESDDVIARRFLDDLHDLHPRTRGLVGDVRVQRWEHGNVFARPGRHRLQPPLEGALGAHGNLHLAGDYFAELGNMEAAALTGAAAAERIEARLGEPPSSVRPPTRPAEVPHV